MSARVTIGDFSRASHLSVKTLRHYHEVGLPAPSEIDPEAGYRYYSAEQIAPAQVIRRLRGLQMPVAEVRAVLAAPDPPARNRLIMEHLDRLEANLASTAAAVAELRALIARPDEPSAVQRRTVPAGPAGGLYGREIFNHGRGPATVYIPTGTPAGPIGRVQPCTIPAAELAIMVHHGSLADGDLTYGELGPYVLRHEISVEGPLRESYLVGFLDAADPARWETEIGWPVFRAGP